MAGSERSEEQKVLEELEQALKDDMDCLRRFNNGDHSEDLLDEWDSAVDRLKRAHEEMDRLSEKIRSEN